MIDILFIGGIRRCCGLVWIGFGGFRGLFRVGSAAGFLTPFINGVGVGSL